MSQLLSPIANFTLFSMLNACFLLSLITLLNMAGATPTPSPDHGVEYTMTITSPNLTLVNDNLFVCTSADVPFPNETSYIVEIAPIPVQGVYYHITVLACDEPGYRNPAGGKSAWDCGTSQTYERFTGLPRAEQCESSDSPHGSFKYQFQGGSADEGRVRLPDGTGIPTGANTGRKSIVFAFHFPKLSQTIGNRTAVTEVSVTFVKDRPDMKVSTTILTGAFGFIGANSVSTVSGVWTLEQDIPIHPTVVYTHSHSLATKAELLIERSTGTVELIHERDYRIFKGMASILPGVQPLRSGDKLVLKCTYNNTASTNVRVWNAEMCYMILYYFVDGQKTPDQQLVYSVDPVYKDCFPGLEEVASFSKNEAANYEGRSSFHGATAEQCAAPLVLHSDANVDSQRF